MRKFHLILVVLFAFGLAGCAGRSARCCPQGGPDPKPPGPGDSASGATNRAPVDPMGRAFYAGETGERMDFEAVAAGTEDADVVAFGELHGHLVGAEIQLRLLKAMAAGQRPVALAMEFLERDTQAAVDQYLAGEIDVHAFKTAARLSPAYGKTHGPLVDFCKANGIAVIAANAPRPLVKAYRSQDEDYPTFLASLTDDERASLPRSTSTPDDAYKEKFLAFMGPKRGPAFFRSQSLWDDAMGEAVTDFRQAHPDHRVLLVVGGFHVTGHLGTMTKIRQRRPEDRAYVLVMSTGSGFAWDPDDKGSGDAILRVVPQPKPKPKHPSL